MRKSYLAFLAIAFLFGSFSVSAQYSYNPLNPDSVGLTFNAIVNQLETNTDPVDTGESGMANIANFFKTFWLGRVVQNDSPNLNIFNQYYSALNSGVSARVASGCSTSGCHGNWKELSTSYTHNPVKKGILK